MVHAGNSHSSKLELSPLSPEDLAKLAERFRKHRVTHVGIEDKPTQPRSIKRRLTGQQRREIQQRVDAGETKRALAKEFGVSETGIGEMLLRAKVEIRTTPITEEDIERAVALYEGGLSVRKIVVELRYSVGTIRHVLKRRGVRMRVRGRS